MEGPRLRPAQALYDGMRAAASKMNSAGWYNFANALGDMNQTRQSLPVYQKALQLNPKNAPAWNNLGVHQEEVGMYKEAMQSYQQAATLHDSVGQQNFHRLNRAFQTSYAQQRAAGQNSESAYQRSMRQLNHDLLFYGHPVLAGDRP
jgi:tetratricopeptide (TPR) repeat protein